MTRRSGKRPAETAPRQTHRFLAEGSSPFIKAPRGCGAQWNLEGNLHLAASGGLISTPTSLAAIGNGTFRIAPIDATRLRVEYSDPVYLLKYEKLHKTIRNRFDFELDMGSQLRENLWPYLFDYYMKTGEWPLKRREYARIFRSLLRAVDSKGKQSSRVSRVREKLRTRLTSALLTRVDNRRSADRIAADAGHITHQIISSESYGELIAEMEMIRSISSPHSVVPLSADNVKDEMRIRIPFEIAIPKRIVFSGLIKVDYRWQYGEFFDRTFICSSLELYPISAFVLQQYCKVFAKRAYVPLDEGSKKVYGIRLDAPMICKGKEVTFEILKPPRKRLLRSRRNAPRPTSGDPTNMRLRFLGTEA